MPRAFKSHYGHMEGEMKTGRKSMKKAIASIASGMMNGAAIAISLSTLLYWRVLESMDPAELSYLAFLGGS